jgi:hypothetical protein
MPDTTLRTAAQEKIPAFRALREHGAALPAHKHYFPNGGAFIHSASFAVLWLTDEELRAPPCQLPDRCVVDGWKDTGGESAWTRDEPEVPLVLVPVLDPNAAKPPVDFGMDGRGKLRSRATRRNAMQESFELGGYVEVLRERSKCDVDGLHEEDYPSFHKQIHLGGTSYAVEPFGRGLSARYLEIEDGFGGINFGGGNGEIGELALATQPKLLRGQLDLESGELDFAN